MHTYVIERNIPGAGRLSAAELAAASRVSNEEKTIDRRCVQV
jgi:hypothetical protein